MIDWFAFLQHKKDCKFPRWSSQEWTFACHAKEHGFKSHTGGLIGSWVCWFVDTRLSTERGGFNSRMGRLIGSAHIGIERRMSYMALGCPQDIMARKANASL